MRIVVGNNTNNHITKKTERKRSEKKMNREKRSGFRWIIAGRRMRNNSTQNDFVEKFSVNSKENNNKKTNIYRLM